MTTARQKSANTIEPLAILRRSKVFRKLAPDVLRDIATTSRIERFKERSLIAQRGTILSSIRYIVEGGVELSMTTADGREARLPPHRPGDWATWAGCFVDTPLPHDLWAAPSSTMLTLPRQVVRSAVAQNSEAMLETLDSIGKSLRALMSWHFSVSLASDQQRVAQLLFHLAERNRRIGDERSDASVTQEQIAQLGLGTRQRVARLLRGLEAQNLIEMHYATVTVRSLERLREFGFGAIEG